jgi:2-dehydro-3-deoxygalactonokinase
MMRGEETQLLGLLSRPEARVLSERGWVILPGTHSKHIRLRDHSVVGLRTYMTGEVFAVLCEHSLLRFTTQAEETDREDDAFLEGVERSRSHDLAGSLFQARTRSVLRGKSNAANRSFLSGLLIGAEWTVLARESDRDPVLIAAPSHLGRCYHMAAIYLGLGDRITLATEEDLNRAIVEGHRQLLTRFTIP